MYLYLVDELAQMRLLRSDPWYFFHVLLQTVWTQSEFYLKSMIGYFGWLDFGLHPLLYFMIAILFCIGMYHVVKHDKKVWSLWHIIFMVCVIGGILFGQFFYFYVKGTPVGEDTIESLQGRYFLPLIPFVVVCISQLVHFLGKKWIIMFSGICFFLLMIGSYGWAIYFRYYDYASMFENKEVLSKELQGKTGRLNLLEYISIEKESEYILPVSRNNKIGGFQIVVKKPEKPVYMLYRYQILHASCRDVYREGYLHQTELQETQIASVFFRPFFILEDEVCVKFFPQQSTFEGYPLMVFSQKKAPIIEFLYVKK